MQRYASLFAQAGIDIKNYANTATLLEQADRRMVANSTVLIKGGRLFEFEKITAALQQQQHETVLEINLAAIAANLQAYRALLVPGTKIMVMLKAFGYGSTDAELGRWLQHHGVDYLAVAYADEGMALREGGVRLPIMVLNPEPGAFEQIVNHRLEPEIFSFDLLKAFEAFAAANGLHQYPIHLKLDTGMHRLGFLPHEADRLADALTGVPQLRVASVFTHLVASENPKQDAFTRQQASLFDSAAKRLSQKLGYTFLLHAANTAGILRHRHLHYDMVRLGIGLFGTGATPGIALQPATRLLTTVAQVKQVNAGESVGYGRHAMLSRNSTIATVRIGYADGYRRAMGNGTGSMWLHGQAVPVVGNVCMDMTMLDVTDLPCVKPGDRVEVFGDHISVNELARWCNTIPYEIMTGISRRVKRVLVEE
jgi:alanine racemase